MKLLKKYKWILIPVGMLIFINIVNVYIIFSVGKNKTASRQVSFASGLKVFTAPDLKKYNGTDPALPIYLALDGNVYDVTKGKEFYQTGGPYHDLAGVDSSFQLHIAGGDIIKRKYPIVGRLQPK